MWRTAKRRFVGHVFLGNPFLPIPFGNSKHPLPTRSRFLRAAVRSTRFALCLHHAHPFVAAEGKRTVSHREEVGFVTELSSPRFVTIQWCCPQSCNVTAANEWSIVEIELSATRVGSGAASLSAADIRKMWRTAKGRFVRHVFLRNPFLPIPFGNSKHPLPTRSRFVRAVRSTRFASCLHHAHLFVAAEGKRTVSHREEVGFVTELSSPRFVAIHRCCPQSCSVTAANEWTIVEIEILATLGWKWGCQYYRVIVSKIWITGHWLCFELWHVTAANEWTIVEIELLATLGWKRGCQPLSCRCSQNVMHFRMEICSTCLLRSPFLPIPFGNSKHPLLARSRFQSAAVRSTSSALCLHHAHPFVAAEGKRTVSHGEEVGFVTELSSPRFVTIQWLCSQLCYVSAANEWTIVEIELLATLGWKWGCQPFSCRCLQNVMHFRMEICPTCLLRNPFLPIHFLNSKHPLPTRSRFLRAAVRSTRFALCLHYAHPFVAAAEKRPVSCREAECLVTELWSPRSVTMHWLCSYVTAANWAFSLCGLEVWLPAFQLPMFAEPKEDLLDMFV